MVDMVYNPGITAYTNFDIEALPYARPLSIEEACFLSIIDNSMITDFRLCEQKWFFKHCRKLALFDDNVHLISGGAYAKGLEVTRKRYFDDGWPMQEALRAGIRAAIIYYGAFEPHGKHAGKNIWRVIGAMEWHFNKWPINSNLIPYKKEGTHRHAIEFSFAEPIANVANPDNNDILLYAGKCDFIGIDTYAGLTGPVDDKTTSQLGEYWLNKWDLSNQMWGYIWASRRAGYNSNCAFIRGVSILKTKYGEANARCYARPDQLEVWEFNLQKTVKRMIRVYNEFKELGWTSETPPEFVRQTNPFQLNLAGACTDFGGCGFKPLCESENPELWIPVNFTVNTWNPLESRD
jgi:hypothetical protein